MLDATFLIVTCNVRARTHIVIIDYFYKQLQHLIYYLSQTTNITENNIIWRKLTAYLDKRVGVLLVAPL